MFPVIRTGFASTMQMVAAWWQRRDVRLPPPSPAGALAAQGKTPTDEPLNAALADESLRRFLCHALDEEPAARDAPEIPETHLPLLIAARKVLDDLVVEAKYLPRRPSLLPKLLSTMNSDQSSMRDLAGIIGDDPALMGNLVRVANSSFYRGVRKSIESLERAVTLVGTDGIRGLIATALLHPVMTTRCGRFANFPENIWEQTLYAADAAEMHAVHVERINGFGARLLALLHGLATNAVFRVVRDECLAESGAEARPIMVTLLTEWTSPTARRIAATWEMPRDVQLALDDAQVPGPLHRSLAFGRIAGAQVFMLRRGQLRESVARATVLAVDDRRMQADRVWNRLLRAHLTPR